MQLARIDNRRTEKQHGQRRALPAYLAAAKTIEQAMEATIAAGECTRETGLALLKRL